MDARRGTVILWMLLTWLSGAAALPAALSVEASVNAETVGTEDLLRLTITVRDTTVPDASEPDPGELEGFQILGPPSFARMREFINGRSSASLSWTWTLSPPGPGEYVLGPFLVRAEGRSYETNRIRVRVVEGSVRQGSSPSPFGRGGRRGGGRNPETIRILTEVSEDEVYAGEAVVLTYRLQTTLRLLEGQLTEAPEFPGFLVHGADLRQRARQVGEEDGVPLYEHLLARYALIPLEAGAKGIPRVLFRLAFRVPQDSFGFGFFDRKRQEVKSGQPLVIQVLPLPSQGVPAGYTGAVGRFDLESSVSGNRGQVGEALTLRLTLSGQGNFPQIGPPRLEGIEGFRVYDPQVSGEFAVVPGGLSGRRVWEYVLVPRRAGTLEIPSVPFSTFHPGEAEYRTLSTRPLEVRIAGSVDPGLGGEGTEGAASPAGEDEATGLFALKHLDAGTLARGSRPPWRPWSSSWFWWVAFGPFALSLLVGAVRLRGRGREQRRRRRRIRRALPRARAGLRQARGHLKQDQEFFFRVHRSLTRYLADRTGMRVGGPEAAERLLAAAGVDRALRDDFVGLLQRCEEGRFRPEAAQTARKKELLEHASRLLSRVEKERLGGDRKGTAAAVLALLCLALGAASHPARATEEGDGLEEISRRAAAAWARGGSAEAEALYRSLLGQAPYSAHLHYDLGVVLFRSGREGEGLRHLEVARRLDPSDPGILRALGEARREQGLPHPPGAFLPELLARAYGVLPASLAALGALVLWGCGWMGWVGRGLAAAGSRARERWTSFTVACLTGAVFLGLLVVGYQRFLLGPPGVVALQATSLRSGPALDFPVLGPLPEGAQGELLRRRSQWVQVRLPSGLTGWLPADSAGLAEAVAVR